MRNKYFTETVIFSSAISISGFSPKPVFRLTFFRLVCFSSCTFLSMQSFVSDFCFFLFFIRPFFVNIIVLAILPPCIFCLGYFSSPFFLHLCIFHPCVCSRIMYWFLSTFSFVLLRDIRFYFYTFFHSSMYALTRYQLAVTLKCVSIIVSKRTPSLFDSRTIRHCHIGKPTRAFATFPA